MDVPTRDAAAPRTDNAQARDDSAPMTLYVCTTCRDPHSPLGVERPGAQLQQALDVALAAVEDDPMVKIVPVECLSVCKRPCTVAFAAPGKWTYVYGDLPPETSAAALLEGARLYARARDGIIPWKLRPDALKKGVVSRVPPLSQDSAS